MVALEKINKAIKFEDPLKRHMAIAATIADELQKAGSDVAIVGGTAVQFYTAGDYMTQDIDFVATRTDKIKEVMTNLGFKNDAGTWYLPGQENVVVEFPGDELDGSWQKTQPVELPDHGTVKVIGVEDIIIDRACAAKFWKDQSDTWVASIMYTHNDKIDWDYLYKRADYELVRDVIDKCKEWVENNKSLIAETELAATLPIDNLIGEYEQRINAIINFKPNESITKTCTNEYLRQAQKIYTRQKGWPGFIADQKITQKLLEKGYSKQQIIDTIVAKSPQTVGISKTKALQNVQRLVNGLDKGLSR